MVIPRDERRIQDVCDGRRNDANALWWGFDPIDSTESIQSAINSGASIVTIPRASGEFSGLPWIVGPIKLVSNQKIILQSDVIIQAKKGAFLGKFDSLFSASGTVNTQIIGGGDSIYAVKHPILAMRKHEYQSPQYEASEWRHVLALDSVDGFKISGVNIDNGGGDGIYVGGSKPSRNVHIAACSCYANYRNGISVVSGIHVRIDDCVFAKADGTRPKSGIHIEPNKPDDVIHDVVVRNTTVDRNSGSGIVVDLSHLNHESAPVRIDVDQCRVRSSYGPGLRFRNGNGTSGRITFRDCKVSNTVYPGLWCIWDQPSSLVALEFIRTHWEKVATNPNHHPFHFHLVWENGWFPIIFDDCSLSDEMLDRQIFDVESSGAHDGCGIEGTLFISDLSKRKTIEQVRQEFPNLKLVEA